MATALPPIYRDCLKLLVPTELMVLRFVCHHKYTMGSELRAAAMGLMRQVSQAVHDRAHPFQHVQALAWKVDDKLSLQLAVDVGAFKHTVRGSSPKPSPSFHAFEQAADLAVAIGEQYGCWWRSLFRRHAWLGVLFSMDAQAALHARWVLQGVTLAQPSAWLREQWPRRASCVVQRGVEMLHFVPSRAPDGSRVHAPQFIGME